MQTKMKHFDTFFNTILFLIIVTFVSIPISGVYQSLTLQKTINQECNTNYSLIEVALNGDNLIQLCKVKNQTVTIK